MATLQKIRNHGPLLLIIVGVAMLAFILGDALNSGSSFFNSSREYVGNIQGHKIHYLRDYEKAFQQLTDVYKIQTGNTNITDEDNTYLRNQVWQSMLIEWTLRTETDKIGMDVTNDELSQLLIGQNAMQFIRSNRMFADEDGQFSPEIVVNIYKQIFDNDLDVNDEQAAGIDQYKNYWLYMEQAARITRLQEKYTNLLGNMITANNIDAKYAYLANQSSVNAQYVMQSYATIADSTISVTNADLKRVYNQHKKQFKQEPNRSIEYISFAIVPSAEDFAKEEAKLIAIEEEFKTTEQVAQMVHDMSAVAYMDINYSINTIPAEYKDFAFGPEAQKDAFMPLTLAGDTYRMARIMECGYSLPDSVRLCAIIDGEEEAEAYWYTELNLRPDIAKQAFTTPKGGTFTITDRGNEVTLKCVDATAATPKVKIAMIERQVTASDETKGTLYNQAQHFIMNNPNDVKMRETAQAEGLTITPAYNCKKTDNDINSIKQSREIIKWAFQAKEGQLSKKVFECGDQYIVAALTEVSDDEYKTMEEVDGYLRSIAIQDAKAEQIMANLAAAKTLEEAATISGSTIQSADNIQLSESYFADTYDPAAVGAAFATKAGQLSAPVKGMLGVYVMVPGQTVVAESEQNDAAMIEQLNRMSSQTVMNNFLGVLLDQADIKDNRFNFE